MLAGLWGIDLQAPDARRALEILLPLLNDRGLFNEVFEALPPEAQSALRDLAKHGGRLSWSRFSRRYGEVRPMGAARRERERPDLNPASVAEVLWYRGLIGRAFLDIPPDGPQEYAYIPEEWLPWLSQSTAVQRTPLVVRAATTDEVAHPRLASDAILDQACTHLAALRSGVHPPETAGPVPAAVMHALLQAAGLLDSQGQPQPEAIQQFLQAHRAQALLHLFLSWRESVAFNELRLLPHLVCEGRWDNDPLQARRAVLEMLTMLPQDPIWWSLEGFVEAVYQQHPDFQRPAGDYDSWFIRRAGSEYYLRGFDHWDEVDGALLRFLITGPLHWLGVLDLASATPDTGAPAQAFRFSAWAVALLAGLPPEGLPEENAGVLISPDGRITVPALAPRWLRYQIARFGDWLPADAQGHHYLLSPASLQRARKQGLRVEHLVALLQKHSVTPVPPVLVRALQNWEAHGVQARIEGVILLRVSHPDVMAAIRRTPAARHLAEVLSPTLAIVRRGQVERLRRALAEAGYLAEVSLGEIQS